MASIDLGKITIGTLDDISAKIAETVWSIGQEQSHFRCIGNLCWSNDVMGCAGIDLANADSGKAVLYCYGLGDCSTVAESCVLGRTDMDDDKSRVRDLLENVLSHFTFTLRHHKFVWIANN